jgi:hypothetical protein
MSNEIKANVKLTTIVAVAAFIFSALGTFATQSFIAGRYTQTIEQNALDIKLMIQDIKEHKVYDDMTYLKKEVFDESVKRRDEMFMLILAKLDKIEAKINR